MRVVHPEGSRPLALPAFQTSAQLVKRLVSIMLGLADKCSLEYPPVKLIRIHGE
jgi:hypothetical protein